MITGNLYLRIDVEDFPELEITHHSNFTFARDAMAARFEIVLPGDDARCSVGHPCLT